MSVFTKPSNPLFHGPIKVNNIEKVLCIWKNIDDKILFHDEITNMKKNFDFEDVKIEYYVEKNYLYINAHDYHYNNVSYQKIHLSFIKGNYYIELSDKIFLSIEIKEFVFAE